MNNAQMNYELVRDWLYFTNKGHLIQEYFEENSYTRIVIYGAGDLGILLLDNLKNTSINVIDIYDYNAANIYLDKPVHSYQQQVIKADCIVVTAIYEFDVIKEMLEAIYKQPPIISLEEIIRFFG